MISNLFLQKRFGFSKKCSVLCWSGDNPSALVALGCYSAGDVGISLGTSDTLFALCPAVDSQPSPLGHIFPSPGGADADMLMLCFANGSLTREAVRIRNNLRWDEVAEELVSSQAGAVLECDVGTGHSISHK